MMAFPGHNSHLYSWRRLGTTKTSAQKNCDIDQWRKRVEEASECAISEAFNQRKPHSGCSSLSVPLHSSDQLRDHDDAYSEAQALLDDWLNSRLRLELELEEDDDLMCSAGKESPVDLASAEKPVLKYNNFDDLYNCLAMEEEHSAVRSFLQNLMEQELVDCGLKEGLALDVGQTRKKFRDPIVTMEARHLQVRENRARREAERQRQQKAREAQQAAREEARRRERDKEMRMRQEARRQEEMVQQEMVKLRRQMEERREQGNSLRQRIPPTVRFRSDSTIVFRCQYEWKEFEMSEGGAESITHIVKHIASQLQRERERVEGQRAARGIQSAPPLHTEQQQQQQQVKKCLYREQKMQTMGQMHDLKCLQRHFSGWYSVVLDRRLRVGKAMALCDWKRQLRAWRGWRAVVWAQKRQRELARTEEELRAEYRQSRLAVESDRQRLLRRCLNEWKLWCRKEKEQRDLLAQQQETRRKMAALINAASTGKLSTMETQTQQPIIAPPEAAPTHANTTEKQGQHSSSSLAPDASTAYKRSTSVLTVTKPTQPTQPWQVTRQHAALTATELHEARQRAGGDGVACTKSTAPSGSRFENRHAVQQQIITQQRKLLKEQQEQIARLKEEQSMVTLELQMEKTAQLTKLSMLRGQRPKSHKFDPSEQRAQGTIGDPEGQRKALKRQTPSNPIISAMEARARQRAERRKEIQELRRKKDEEKLAEMKAAEELRQREEEEEKRKAAEKKREEKRQEKEREEEKQRQLKRQQELLKQARQHYHRTLLLHRGLAPWKRLIQLRQANEQLADSHHNLFVLRRCIRGWQQSAKQSLLEKEASADQLYQRFLLQRSLSCWKRLMDWRMIQEERAERFYRTRILRKFLLALQDHVTQERMLELERQALSDEHNNRRVLRRCFLAWTKLPCVLRKEREKEVRRERLGRKVAEVLPDFWSRLL